MTPWPVDAPGVLVLPDGRRVRGRGAAGPPGPQPGPAGPHRLTADLDDLPPQFGLYLRGRRPPAVAWPARWVRWPDFAVPLDAADARAALREAFERAARERVEVACGGGVGRTGTALACLAVLAGLDPRAAVAHVRAAYHPRAVETPWQRRWVARFAEWAAREDGCTGTDRPGGPTR